MRDWTLILDELIVLQSQPCVFPVALSLDTQKKLLAHNQYVIERLIIFAKLPLADGEKERRLRLFLAMRSAMIVNSSIDYTFNPYFPANIACLKIAVLIAKEDEAVCQLIMPSIKKIIGTGFLPEEIKSASEDIHGQFTPHNFLMHQNGEALIGIPDLFELARANTHYLFPTEEKKEAIFDLSAEDRERIRIIAGEASQRYFDALKHIHIIQQGQKPSIGFALKELQLALLKSSKVGDGSEESANIAECRQPILQFYRLWTSLPDDMKARIKHYKAGNDRFFLESYLLCLFVHIKECAPEIVITEAECKRVVSEKIFPCTHQINLQLDSLLKHNPDLFNLLLPGFTQVNQEALPNAEMVDQLSQRLEQDLKNRLPILGLNDQRCIHCLPCFEILSCHCFDETHFNNDIAKLGWVVTTIDEFIFALIVLPTQYWELFIAGIHNFVCETIKCRNTPSTTLAYILTCLHSQDWPSFFNALYTTKITFLLNGRDLSLLQDKFSDTQKRLLVESMGKMLDFALLDGVDVAFLFMATPIDYWGKVFALFERRIEVVLENPDDFATVFKLIRAEDRMILFQLFKSIIVKNIKKNEFLEAVLSSISAAERINFLRGIENHLDKLVITPLGFLRLLRLFNLTNWALVLTLCSHQVKEIIKSDVHLATFLDYLCNAERIVFLREILSNNSNIKTTAPRLHILLMHFSGCEISLLHFYKMQLVDILSECISTFQSDFENEVLPALKAPFKYIAPRALPFLLTGQNLSLFCPSFFEHAFRFFGSLPNPVLGVYHAIQRIDHGVVNGEITMSDGCTRRVEILKSFIQKTRDGQFPRTPFYDELNTYFGREFFSKLSTLLPQLQTVVPFPVTPAPTLQRHRLGAH